MHIMSISFIFPISVRWVFQPTTKPYSTGVGRRILFKFKCVHIRAVVYIISLNRILVYLRVTRYSNRISKFFFWFTFIPNALFDIARS